LVLNIETTVERKKVREKPKENNNREEKEIIRMGG
jgi:hypothetical protein